MDRADFRNRSILTIYPVGVTLYAMDTTDIQRHSDNYEILSTDAALRAERIACRLRHLIYSAPPSRGRAFQSASVAQGISIAYERVLGALPASRSAGNGKFRVSLDRSISLWSSTQKEQPLGHRNCVVCFGFTIKHSPPGGCVIMTIWRQQLLDLLSTFVMVDDTGLLCDAYNITSWESRTAQDLCHGKNFPQWLQAQESLKTISDFYLWSLFSRHTLMAQKPGFSTLPDLRHGEFYRSSQSSR
ncbi:MAG: DUF6100 family protein [Eubacteriales bacterium]